MESKSCSICLETCEILVYSRCNHFVCLACTWTLRDVMSDCKCPICREYLPWVRDKKST